MSVLCAARDSMQLQQDIIQSCVPIRGQVSWLNNPAQQMDMHTAYSYGGLLYATGCRTNDYGRVILSRP